AGAACLRQPDRDRLLGRARPVFAPADMLDLLVDELSGRGGRAFARAQLVLCLLDRRSVWHTANLSCAAFPASSARRRDADADRARHAGAADAAVAVGVLRQVLLVVILGVEELRRRG